MDFVEEPGPGSIDPSPWRFLWAGANSVLWYLSAPLAIALTIAYLIGFELIKLPTGVDFRAVLVTIPFVVIVASFLAAASLKHSNPDADAETIEFGPERPVTRWRLCDPQLSHWGVWRADLGRLPPEIDGFRSGQAVKEFIRKVLLDRTRTSARGNGLVQRVKAMPSELSPFGDGRKDWKVYRVFLESGDTGWFRFGAGWIEFQLSRNPTDHVLLRPDSSRGVLKGSSRCLAPPRLSSDPEPLWDRWLDG